MSIVTVENMTVQLHSRDKMDLEEVLHKISFTVEPGEILGIVGESGAGKSICMKALKGLIPDTKGTVTGRIQTARHQIAMIFQDTNGCLNQTMQIGEQIAETVRIHDHCSRKEARQQAMRLLDMVGIRNPNIWMKQYPMACSGGMRQRVVIAIALACHPQLLIADEPTTALDVTVQAQIIDLLKKIAREQHMTMIVVSHDMGVIASLCQRIIVMEAGNIIEQGETEEIFYHAKKDYTRRLIQNSKYTKIQKNNPVRENAILQIEQLSKEFGTQVEAVRQLDLTIWEGETYGLVGESGCGKSTLARMIMGITAPTEGTIKYRGERIDFLDRKQRFPYRRKMQMIFQDPYGSLNPSITITETLQEMICNIDRDQGIKRKNNRQRQREWDLRLKEVFQTVGLEENLFSRYPKELSGGQCQRVGIARALLANPEFLICDEPTTALDATVRQQIISLLCKLQEQKNLTYLFIAHDLELVQQICDRIGVMYLGAMLEEGTSMQLCKEPWHPYTKTLLSASLVADPRKAYRKKHSIRWQPQSDTKTLSYTGGNACPYVSQCKYAVTRCKCESPALYEYEGRKVACFLYAYEAAAVRDSKQRMISQI